MTLLSNAATFARSVSYDNLPEKAINTAKLALIDYLGVTLAGSTQPVSKLIRKYVRINSTRCEARVIGTDIVVSRNLAALANGVAGHALDYDDCNNSIFGHSTVPIAPALLATGELTHASGKEIIKAFIVGMEVQNKIAQLISPTVSENGWHTTSVFGTLGAATVAALLTGAEHENFINTLGIAASKSSGIRANFGTLTKPYHAGMAAYNGVTASILASLGFTASESALEAEDGFIKAFSGQQYDGKMVRFGKPWDIINPGLIFKRYPCCSGTHPAIDCILDILNNNPFSADQVESIKVGTSLLGPRELVCHNPTNCNEAKFSMEYALAAAIVYRKVGLNQFTTEAVNDLRIKKLLPKIKMEIDSELAKLGFIGTAPVKLTIHLKDGRKIEDKRDLAKGNPEKPLSDKELYSKFIECASIVLNLNRCHNILEGLLSLEEINDINLIIGKLY